MRQFAILGLGDYGYWAAVTLAESGMDVLVVDSDETSVNNIKDKVSQAVVADVTDRATLESLGVIQVDCAMVNLGSRVDNSILTTMYLREAGVKEIVVKAVSEEHSKVLHMVGATRVVFPEKAAGINIAKSLVSPNVLDFIPLADDYSIVALAPPERYIGNAILDTQIRSEFNLNILAVTQEKMNSEDRKMIFPLPDYKIKTDDQLLVMGKEENIQKFQDSYAS